MLQSDDVVAAHVVVVAAVADAVKFVVAQTN